MGVDFPDGGGSGQAPMGCSQQPAKLSRQCRWVPQPLAGSWKLPFHWCFAQVDDDLAGCSLDHVENLLVEQFTAVDQSVSERFHHVPVCRQQTGDRLFGLIEQVFDLFATMRIAEDSCCLLYTS